MFRKIVPILLVVGLAFGTFSGALAGAGSGQALAVNQVIVPSGSPIQIAAAMYAGFPTPQDLPDAVQMAINDHGLIKGFHVSRVDFDSGCSESEGNTAGQAIVANSQIVGVIGPICSLSTEGAAPHFETAKLVMISPSNTYRELNPYGPNVFNRVVVYDPGYNNYWGQEIASLPSVSTWQAGFNTVYGRQPDEYAKFAYDAARLLLRRIEEISVLDGSSNLVIDRQLLAAAVRNTYNYPGVTGLIILSVLGDRIDRLERIPWADEFDSPTLDSRWLWLNENPAYWSLTARPGFMRITTNASVWSNRLLRRIPHEDFEMRTHLFFTPTNNYQIAGLMVYGDASNLMQLGRAYCNTPSPACEGDAIYFDYIVDDVMVGGNCATAVMMGEDIYLRIVHNGDDYAGYISTDGTSWTHICTKTSSLDFGYIGLVANNQSAPNEIPADFEFFTLEQEPVIDYLPLIAKK